ncbi:MAG: hypothetical protein GXY19_14780 [Phycisphaerae bacterium]|nr:hypothetical protein [Phycisphaerae bacterium]
MRRKTTTRSSGGITYGCGALAWGHGAALAGGLMLVAALATGCGIGSERKAPAEIKVQQIAREKTELMRDLQQAKAENQQLAEQIKALSVFPEDKPLNPYRLQRVKITRYSNFYDKDNDGKREKLIVYVEPVDLDGDAVKAAGTVDVQLWNLNNLNGQAMLGQWQVDPNDLRKLWYDTLVSANYRLTFDAPPELDVLAEPLTVKVTFTDYLTGEIFRDQYAINPRLDQ